MFFSTFLWRPLHDYDVKLPKAKFYGGRARERTRTVNFPFSAFWSWVRIQLQELEKSPTFDKLSGPNRRDKSWKDANSFSDDFFTNILVIAQAPFPL